MSVPTPELKDRQGLRQQAKACITDLAQRFHVNNLNRIKPGIAEATRAILRRKPEAAFVRSLDDPDLQALVHLCRTDGVELVEDAAATGPYRAITLIEKLA